MDITIKRLSEETLNDFLHFFDNMVFSENPDWAMCYCYSFHFTGTKEEWNKEANRSSAIKFIKKNKMKGYLAYSGNIPIGWCNANNRLNYERLLKYYDLIDKSNNNICSIVCFLINPEFRRKSVAEELLKQVTLDYTHEKYKYLEAYPGKGNLSCEKHFMGPLRLYEKYGFTIEKEFKDYYLVRKKLN